MMSCVLIRQQVAYRSALIEGNLIIIIIIIIIVVVYLCTYSTEQIPS
jgi:hypothetical protein